MSKKNFKKQDVDFFNHFKIVFDKLQKDSRIKSRHMSAYLVLFRKWNNELFPFKLTIYRSESMKAMKIGSKVTYTSTLKELNGFGYIKYTIQELPKRSIIEMVRFDTVTSKTGPENVNNDTEYSPESGANSDLKEGHINKNNEISQEKVRNRKEDQKYNQSTFSNFFSK